MQPKTTVKFNIHTVYRPLLFAMLICGYNLGCIKNLKSKIAFNIYAIILITVISYNNMTCCPSEGISFVWSLIEYDLFVIITMLMSSKVNIYLQKISEIDGYLRINRRHYYRTRTKIFVCTILVWLCGVAYTTTFCFITICYSLTAIAVYQFSLLAMDGIRVWRYSLFEGIWRRLRLLRKRMQENPGEDYYIYVKNCKLEKEDKVKLCLCLYKKIANLLDLMAPEISASVSRYFTYLCNF